MSSRSMNSASFILSLIGGLIILLGSVIAFFLLEFGSPYGDYYGFGPGMMAGYGFNGYGNFSGWLMAGTIVALVAGIFVVIGALMLRTRPAEHMTWGIVVLVSSIVSFVGMGGYMIGAILGIAGGAVALSYSHRSA